jgi:hypothetical protein
MTDRRAAAIATILRSGGTEDAAKKHLIHSHAVVRQAAQERLDELSQYPARKGPGNGFFAF